MGRITIDEVKKRLGKIYSKEPSRKIGIIYDYEKNHRLLVVNKFGPFTKYFEDSFDFLLDAVYSINYLPKKNWGWKRNLQYLYFASATKPLFKAFTLTLDGFYDEASTILRTPYELLIKIIFCSCYPNDFWITYANPPKGQKAFNLSNFLQEDLKVDWKFLYSLTSGSSHGKMYVTQMLKEVTTNKTHEPVGFVLKYNEKLITLPINQLTFLMWLYIRLLFIVFHKVNPNEETNNKFRKEMRNFDKALGSIVRTMPNKLKIVARDSDKVVRIVRVAEKGGNWKSIA